MAQTLTDNQIALTYKGVVHAQGAALPVNGSINLCDGEGNLGSISIGRTNGGLSISGGLSANGISYPSSAVQNGFVITQTSTNTFSLTSISDALRLAGSLVANGTYNNVQNIVVENGLIVGISVAPQVKTLFLDLETFSQSMSTLNDASSKGVYPYGSRSSRLISSISPQIIAENYLGTVWNGQSTIYGAPNEGDVAIVIYPDNELFRYGSTLNYRSFVYGIKFSYTNAAWTWDRYLCHHYHSAENAEYSDYNDARFLKWNAGSSAVNTISTFETVLRYNDLVTDVSKNRNGL